MPCQLRWLASVSASCFHAVAAIAQGRPLADAQLAAALSKPAEELLGLDLPWDRFGEQLVPLAAGVESNRELAEVTLAKTIGRGLRADVLTDRLTQMITAAEAAVMQALPNLVEELALRGQPLREQWEARGPGMLAAMATLTDPSLIVPSADVILVHPALGGAGRAHLSYNSVRIEAVLANPVAELPEAVRLGWLLAQLNNDLPIYSEMIPGPRLPLISALAMLPAVLTAAERVELASYDAPTVRLALDAWDVRLPADVDGAAAVTQWWDTYLAAKPPWNVALTALDRMLAAAGCGIGSD